MPTITDTLTVWPSAPEIGPALRLVLDAYEGVDLQRIDLCMLSLTLGALLRFDTPSASTVARYLLHGGHVTVIDAPSLPVVD